jgi:hypothetical protein
MDSLPQCGQIRVIQVLLWEMDPWMIKRFVSHEGRFVYRKDRIVELGE